MKALLPTLALLTAAACTTTPGGGSGGGGGGAPSGRVVYQCDRDTEIVVVFSGPTARIESESGPIVLQRRQTPTGFLFESATHSIRGSGDQITYTIGRMAPMTCTALRPTPR